MALLREAYLLLKETKDNHAANLLNASKSIRA
jgi:hypothetical protein